MAEFLAILLAYPTVVWTVLLGVCLVFWAFVIVGAADIDAITGKAEGAVKGVVEGAVKGAVEGVAGAVKGGAEGAVKGAAEGVAGAVKGGAEASSGAELLAFLRLDRAPVTVTGSFFALFGWLVSCIATYLVGGGALVGTGVLLGSAIVSLFLSSLAIRPMGVIFDEATRKGGGALAGKSGVVRSGKVDERSGQAEVDERGASLVVDVRVAPGAEPISKGTEVVIVDYDAAADCYVVAPLSIADDVRAQLVSRPVEALTETAAQNVPEKVKERA